MKLSIIIPARNEAKNIGPTLRTLTGRLRREAIDYEVLVVDDGSIDGTADVVATFVSGDPAVRLVQNLGAHGFGRAVRAGIESFTGDAVVICMADLSDDPDDVVKYFYILRDRAECAFGSRFVRGSRVYDYPPFKLVINRLANLAVGLLFGIPYNDVTNAFKGYRANVIRGCQPLLSPHFNLTVELPLKAIVRGYSYAVVPISWRNRRHGESSLHLQEMGSRYLYVVLNIWLERLLTRGDFHRQDVPPPPPVTSPSEHVEPSAQTPSTTAGPQRVRR
jgi:dolichol-phosphate mannosyltransferase